MFGLFKNEPKKFKIGSDLSWKEAVNTIFKVIDFDRNGTRIIHPGSRTQPGQVKAKSMFQPLGYLIVANPSFDEVLHLPIMHTVDFLLADSIFGDSNISGVEKTFDLLVTYRPKNENPMGLAGIHHALHLALTPEGTLNSYYEKYGNTKNLKVLEDIFIFSWDSVQVNMNQNYQI